MAKPLTTKQADLHCFFKAAKVTIETGADGKEFFQSRDEGGHICTIHSDLVNPLNERQLLF